MKFGHFRKTVRNNSAGTYTGSTIHMFVDFGVVTNTDGSDTSKPTGVGVPSWYE